MKDKNFIIVKDRHPKISEVLNDCDDLCVGAKKGESLLSILKKICSKITNQVISWAKISDKPACIESCDTLREFIIENAPSGSETPNSATDTNSIDITLTGTNNRNIQADVRIHPTAQNRLSSTTSGLLVLETSNNSQLTDSAAVNLSGTLNRTISVDVRISPDDGNGLTVRQDGDDTSAGLYVLGSPFAYKQNAIYSIFPAAFVPSPGFLNNGMIYIGLDAGSTDLADNAVCIGTNAAKNSQASVNSVFIGFSAGENSDGLFNSIILGTEACKDAEGGSTITIGNIAGKNKDHQKTIYIGEEAGSGQGNDVNTIGIGERSLANDYNNNNSIAIGNSVLYQATGPALNSLIIGSLNAQNTGNLKNVTWIGSNVGNNDTLNNFSLTDPTFSILLGYSLNTGGFKNSVLIGGRIDGVGTSANTRDNQFMLTSNIINARFRGIDYTFPSLQATNPGDVLVNDGAGNLSWGSGTGSPTIYSSDGTLGGLRTINMNGYSLNLENSGGFNIEEGDLTEGGSYQINNGVDFINYDENASVNIKQNLLTGAELTYNNLLTLISYSISVTSNGVKAIIPEFADEAAATTGGLPSDYLYKTPTGELRIKL